MYIKIWKSRSIRTFRNQDSRLAALERDDERLDPSTRILTVLARLQFLNAASKLSHNKDRDGV